MESYLGVAAYGQNRGAKPPGRSGRELSQGGAAMRCREEASSWDRAGRPVSQNDGRVSPSRTKPGWVVSLSPWRTSNAVRALDGMARPAFRPGKGFVSLTDEVPRGSRLGSISSIYKAKPKGLGAAPAAGTATPWPRRPQPPIPGPGSVLPKVPHAPACSRGRPVRESRAPVQYEELTAWRQRGGGGFGLPLTHRWRSATTRRLATVAGTPPFDLGRLSGGFSFGSSGSAGIVERT
jgi:hypothetical protein